MKAWAGRRRCAVRHISKSYTEIPNVAKQPSEPRKVREGLEMSKLSLDADKHKVDIGIINHRFVIDGNICLLTPLVIG